MKLLLVEDSRFLRQTITKILSNSGYQVIPALDGEQALVLVPKEMPDAIILDLLLPKMSGLRVLKALKDDATTRRIPVIVLTGLSQKNAGKLEADGAAAFVEKTEILFSGSPESVSSLLAKIEDVLPAKSGTRKKNDAAHMA